MHKSQFLMLGIGVLLGTAAIGLTNARRSLEKQSQDEEDRRAIAAMAEMTPLPQPDEPTPDQTPPPSAPERSEKVGAFTLRVSSDGRGGVFGSQGELVAEVNDFLGARELPGAVLFGATVVELTGKTCEGNCNPTVVLVALKDGEGVEVMRARGVPRLEDLDRDGVPEVMLDHLMNGSREVVTLPFRFSGNKFVASPEDLRDGLDRQLDQLMKAAERICTAEVDDECKDTLRGIVGIAAFKNPGSPTEPIDRMRLEPNAKAFARDADFAEQILLEMESLAP